MNVSYAKQMIENYGDDFELTKLEIKRLFVVGNRYTRKEVKEKLQELYNNLGIKRTAKYTDLSEVMSIKDVKVKGEREEGKVVSVDILGKKVKVKFGKDKEDERFEMYNADMIINNKSKEV